MVDNKTSHLELPLPNLGNQQDEDVPRIAEALAGLDAHAAQSDARMAVTKAGLGGAVERVEALEENALEMRNGMGAISVRVSAVEAKSPELASEDRAGIVKIGEGLAVTEEGTISVPPPPEITTATSVKAGIVIVGEGLTVVESMSENEGSTSPGTLSLASHAYENSSKYGKGDSQFFGHVKLTDDFEQSADATSGIGVSPIGVKTAFNRLVGIFDEQVITTSRTWTVPETGRYQITAVGGGGNGASGGSASSNSWQQEWQEDRSNSISSGGGGGGGGSGERTTVTTTLTKGQTYTLTIGGAGGTTSFDSLLTARGGGNGSPGGSGVTTASSSGPHYGGGGGSAGTSYGGAAGNGGGGSNKIESYYWPEPVYGGGGGSGGTSTDGYYGNGGAGGAGGGQNNTGRGIRSLYGPSGGSAGRQGCIKIKIVPV